MGMNTFCFIDLVDIYFNIGIESNVGYTNMELLVYWLGKLHYLEDHPMNPTCLVTGATAVINGISHETWARKGWTCVEKWSNTSTIGVPQRRKTQRISKDTNTTAARWRQQLQMDMGINIWEPPKAT